MGTLWYGGQVRTLITEDDIQEAVFVRNGMIRGIGKKEELENQYGKEITEKVDINGDVMYPGFVDSHLHLIGHGEKLLRLDLSEVRSITELSEVLSSRLASLPEGTWLIGEGFNENLYPDKRVPTREILDTLSNSHPIMLTRICRHACVTNSIGLELASITGDTMDPPGGVIARDKHGVATGYLLDQAQELIRNVLPERSFTQVEHALKISIDDMLKNGFVGGHSEDLNYYGDAVKTIECFHNIIDGDEMKFRANLLIHHEVLPEIMGWEQENKPNKFIELGSVKIFTDGALGGRTALLSEPYADDASTNGVQIHDRATLLSLVEQARDYDLPVAIHAIGDLALEMTIEAIEGCPPPKGKRDRMIHMQVAREDLIKRLQKLPVILDIQPRFVASDFPWVMERLGNHRLSYAFAWKNLLEANLICAGGSDAPIEPINPLLGIHAAVTRRKPEEDHEGYLPEQKLSLYEAIRLFTFGSAQAIGMEEERGMIAPGYVADFTILSDDLFKLEPNDWLKVSVKKTVVDNTIMYER